MTAWLEPQEVDIPDEFKNTVGGHPLVAQTLFRRGIRQTDTALAFLDPRNYIEASPYDLPGMQQAVDLLESTIRLKKNILVWGDFDVDGQTATSLFVDVLRQVGGQVHYHIPVRAAETHGISLSVLRRLVETEIPDGIHLLLTCDTGVSSVEAVSYARQNEITVVLTDHHELPGTLPDANAIVNPKMLPESHPLGSLPGVGVAYKVAQALCQALDRPELVEIQLDLVALGIVADLAMLTGDTRFLLQLGLRCLRETNRPGLRALFDTMEMSSSALSEEHIGFALAPRLNAIGRLADANPVVELLTTTDPGKARLIAVELEGLNIRRKLLTTQVFQGALAQIERDPSLLETAAIVLAHESWPAGVVGIVASRLVEQFNKPVILIASPPDEIGRGSARSVAGVNITEAIAAQKDLLIQYGGHPMAAGLSIEREKIPEFRRRLSHTLHTLCVIPEATRQIDGYLTFSELTLDLAADLERLAPFGPANPSLTLASRNLRLISNSTIGRDEEHRLLTVEDEAGMTQRVLWWHGSGWPLPEGRFDLAYAVRAVTFRGQREVQVEWVDFRPIELPPGSAPKSEDTIVLDYRHIPHPLGVLKQILVQEEVMVWAEGEAVKKLAGENVHALDRLNLSIAQVLAIWTTPPGRSELLAVLETVKPARVIVFAISPESDFPDKFINRLAGLVKYSLYAYQGRLNLEKLAAATAQRVTVVRKGIDWLAGKGFIRITGEEAGIVLIEESESSKVNVETSSLSRELSRLLEEVRAYRDYFSRVPEIKL